MLKTRSRVWAFIAYPDSFKMDMCRKAISNLHCEGAISPLHDKDTFDELDIMKWVKSHPTGLATLREAGAGSKTPVVGQIKEPHYHVLLAFKGSKSVQQLQDWASIFTDKKVHFEAVGDKQGYLRYLAHLDDLDKAQYNPDDIEPFGNIDLSCLHAVTKAQMYEAFPRMMEIIEDNQLTGFFQLFKAVLAEHDPILVESLVQHTYMWHQYLISYSHSIGR